MKDEYDFSNAERGKFFRPDADLRLPIHLDAEVMKYVEAIAQQRNSDVSAVINELLRNDMAVAKIASP
jgi:hypothetical protein